MAWKCKECGSENFLMSEEISTVFKINFDENGIEDQKEERMSYIEEILKCANCGNTASIFNFIEDIAEWEED